MLANPRQEAITELTTWLGQQGDREYQWYSPFHCACGQYWGTAGWIVPHDKFHGLTGIDLNHIASIEPWTFSALLQRVEERLNESRG